MRFAYLDCFAGISGDMFLAALGDAGVPAEVLQQAVAQLGIGATVEFERVDRSGVSAYKANVMEQGKLAESADKHTHEHTHQHSHGRSLSSIRKLIQAATLDGSVKLRAIRTFELLGEAEAQIHNVPVEKIHFHEVGAVDAIADIVAASAGIEHLAAQGPVQWYCSPVNVGSGVVECAHGTLPVPAPATALLLRGVPTYAAHIEKELTTPTGAAILRALEPIFGSQPTMNVQAIGYGAGTRNPKGFANVLRLCVGEGSDAQEAETLVILESAIDDMNPQLLAHLAEQLLQAGAVDVMQTPVIMKKGRAGILLTVLSKPQDAARFRQMIFRESTTLGIRMHEEKRFALPRAIETVATEFGDIRVKLGMLDGEVLNIAPEYEDCRAAAELHKVAVKIVMQAAIVAYSAGKKS